MTDLRRMDVGSVAFGAGAPHKKHFFGGRTPTKWSFCTSTNPFWRDRRADVHRIVLFPSQTCFRHLCLLLHVAVAPCGFLKTTVASWSFCADCPCPSCNNETVCCPSSCPCLSTDSARTKVTVKSGSSRATRIRRTMSRNSARDLTCWANSSISSSGSSSHQLS